MPTHTMKVGKTNPKEIATLFKVLNELEWLHKELMHFDFEGIEWNNYEVLSKFGQNGPDEERDLQRFIEDLAAHVSGIHFQRILTNCETLLDNCADPDQRTLEFNADIREGLEMLWNHRNTNPGTLRERKPIEVQHAELERIGNSEHTSQCPECTPGALAMRRDPDTMALLPDDACLHCGQRFRYTDVADGKLVNAEPAP